MTRVELVTLFRGERAKFAKMYPAAREATLTISDQKCVPGSPCSNRDLAWCEPTEMRVTVLSRLTRFQRKTVVGVLRHELGHLCDEYVWTKGSEARADQIALEVTKRPIRYDRRGLQTIGPGGARPAWLHR